MLKYIHTANQHLLLLLFASAQLSKVLFIHLASELKNTEQMDSLPKAMVCAMYSSENEKTEIRKATSPIRAYCDNKWQCPSSKLLAWLQSDCLYT